MSEQASVQFTPCFDWVVRATGSSSAALAYGVIWRYAQMRGARCYASCERLAENLAWTRQRIMRHIKVLLSHGLIVCMNPRDRGVTREYVPVDEDHWMPASRPHPGMGKADGRGYTPGVCPYKAWEGGDILPQGPKPAGGGKGDVGGADVRGYTARGYTRGVAPSGVPGCDTPCPVASHLPWVPSPPVPRRDTPCSVASQPPVTSRDTRNTSRITNSKPGRGGHAWPPSPRDPSSSTSLSAPPSPLLAVAEQQRDRLDRLAFGYPDLDRQVAQGGQVKAHVSAETAQRSPIARDHGDLPGGVRVGNLARQAARSRLPTGQGPEGMALAKRRDAC